MKEPIEVDDLRMGDLFFWQDGEEFVQQRAVADHFGWALTRGQHYLIEPRKPAVPDEPTLGWVSQTHGGGPRLALYGWFEWANALKLHNRVEYVGADGGWCSAESVTAFTPATPIPTYLLEELRWAHEKRPFTEQLFVATAALLAAVDGTP